MSVQGVSLFLAAFIAQSMNSEIFNAFFMAKCKKSNILHYVGKDRKNENIHTIKNPGK